MRAMLDGPKSIRPPGPHDWPAGEGILRNLDKIDDEAREAARAAEQGDSKAFAAAREDFMKKVRAILDHVSKDQLIKDADSNPAVPIKIEETLSKSLNALMKAV